MLRSCFDTLKKQPSPVGWKAYIVAPRRGLIRSARTLLLFFNEYIDGMDLKVGSDQTIRGDRPCVTVLWFLRFA